MKLNELKNKRILILGFGKEGQDTFLFLRKLFPDKKIGIADKSEKIKRPDKNSVLYLGKNYLKVIGDYDVIIKSPGVPFKILPKSALKKITTQTDIFFDNCPGKVVGVTGTKGKSTTASMIYEILKTAGVKAHLVGNIGKPVLNLLLSAAPEDVYPAHLTAECDRVYVYELSSHQLYNIRKSPHIAVFLNIYPEHLDYYRNLNEYAKAKANITLWQTKEDFLVYNSEDKLVKEITKKSKAKKIPIKGKYYELDKNAARAVGRIFKIPSKTIEKAIKKFKYLPHRLELVGTYKGIIFYNDALATIPQATMAAMDTLGNKVQTIMLGGFDRNIDFKELAKRVLDSKIKNVILFPTTGRKIWQSIRQAQDKALRQKHPVVSRIEPFPVDNMKDAVRLAYKCTGKGKICLLSCASSSFSIFKDYKEKGNLFKKFVKKYSHG